MPRLIELPSARAQLRNAIAMVPAGEKLSIPRLRDQLVSQADIIEAIGQLVEAGELDRATLRPARPPVDFEDPAEPCPACQDPDCDFDCDGDYHAGPPTELEEIETPFDEPPAPPSPNSGPALADALTAYAVEHGLSIGRLSMHLFGGANALGRLRSTGLPRPATIDKIRALLAGPPPPGLEVQPSGGARPPQQGAVKGAELAAELYALIEREQLSKVKVGRHLFGSGGGVDRLGQGIARRKTVAKVRAFLAGPVPEELRRQDARPSSGEAPAPGVELEAPKVTRRAPASSPEVARAVKTQAVQRGNRKQAERLIEREAAGEAVANVSPIIRATANVIRDQRAADAREQDPVEQAKLALRRRGISVFAAEVSEGDPGKGFYWVGRQRLSERELLLKAGITIDLKPPPAEAEMPRMLPAEIAWCNQCDQRVSGARVAKCKSPFCSLKSPAERAALADDSSGFQASASGASR